MTQVRHDCEFCSHSNDSHDSEIGCLYPNCMCGNKEPAPRSDIWPMNDAWPGTDYTRPARRRHRKMSLWHRVWVSVWLTMASIGQLVIALLVVVGAMLLALAFLVAGVRF